MAARILSLQRIRRVIKESKSNKKKSGGWVGRGWGVARVSEFFSKETKSEKQKQKFVGGGG